MAGRGRPVKGFDEKKSTVKAVRMSFEDNDMLYYLKNKLKKSESEVFRIALKKLFIDEISH